ncbi:MAG TPA: hypothetical protein VMX75_13305, partial [Spirochaetia bacterium]|nr:hypothetical protein [Spirochaetia bacterium]
MDRNRVCLCLVSIILLGASFFPGAQEDSGKPVVAVLPLAGPEGDRTLEALNASITETLRLTLLLMKQYRVADAKGAPGLTGPEEIGRYAEQRGIDNVIFGRTRRDEKGRIVVKVQVYDRLRHRVTLSRQAVAEDIFETFSVADELVVSLVEGFSGVHVAYGGVALLNRGESGDYTVSVDGQEIGKNIGEIHRLLTGEHLLDIEQLRGGKPFRVLREP